MVSLGFVRYINTVKRRDFNESVVDEADTFEHAWQLSAGLVLSHVRFRTEVAYRRVPITTPGLELDRKTSQNRVFNEGH